MGNTESYLGFAVRSGKIIYGIDNIELNRKRKYVIVLGNDASENLHEKASRYSEKFNVPMVCLNESLSEMINKPNCKIVALLDANMAKAVIQSVGR